MPTLPSSGSASLSGRRALCWSVRITAADDDPNVYFHLAMAYAVLRHNGVDVGKMDFLGPINWVTA